MTQDGPIETDYLVIGAGAAGVAFTDALAAACDRTVALVDRRHAPGGHWNDAYPFVRLHQPSTYYGVNSSPLGDDRIDTWGPNSGLYEVAGAADICAHFDRAVRALVGTGQVTFFPSSDFRTAADGSARIVSRLTGKSREVVVRCSVVDATYLETSVPATHRQNFTIDDGVPCVPINALARVDSPSGRYVVLGAGKTAMDACLYLLGQGVDSSRIRWVKPREAWLHDRIYSQPLTMIGTMMEGLARQTEAAVAAESMDDFFRRLEASGMFLRVDERVTPTMYRCATVTRQELDLLRGIEAVVRLGRVKRLSASRIHLADGDVPAEPGDLYVDCTAIAFGATPPKPMFEPGRITLQGLRTCQPCFNSAILGHLEATRSDLDEKNRLCTPNPYPVRPEDFARMFVTTNMSEGIWAQDPELTAWIRASRLNIARGLYERRKDPEVQGPLARLKQSMWPALQNLMRLLETRGATTD